eukprot:m.5863 g.5863  ORF g.5863 m.5863 type:complete len:121 (-) comp2485_c0_seq1:198-560(-)
MAVELEAVLLVRQRGTPGTALTAWKKKRCIVVGTTLSFFDPDQDTATKATHVLELSGCELSELPEPNLGFEVVVANKKTGRRIQFKVPTEEDKVTWLTLLFEKKLSVPVSDEASPSCVLS